jgi:hypothetical protein
MGDFPFKEGETVLVRVRTSGTMTAKFVADCSNIRQRSGPSTPQARFDLPFGTLNSITLAPYEAEFEVVDSAEGVTF